MLYSPFRKSAESYLLRLKRKIGDLILMLYSLLMRRIKAPIFPLRLVKTIPPIYEKDYKYAHDEKLTERQRYRTKQQAKIKTKTKTKVELEGGGIGINLIYSARKLFRTPLKRSIYGRSCFATF